MRHVDEGMGKRCGWRQKISVVAIERCWSRPCGWPLKMVLRGAFHAIVFKEKFYPLTDVHRVPAAAVRGQGSGCVCL